MQTTGLAAMAALGAIMIAAPLTAHAAEDLRDILTFTDTIEVAGADESDRASEEELRKSGTEMVPAHPSASSRDPMTKTAAPETKKPEAEPAAAKAQDQTPAQATQQTTPQATEPQKTAPMKTDAPLSGFYVRVDGGFSVAGDADGSGRNGSHRSTDIDDAGVFDVGIGWNAYDRIRLEAMASYRPPLDVSGTDGAGNAVSTDVNAIGGMVNVYWDFAEAHDWLGNDAVTPYIGAGAGFARLDTGSQTTAVGSTESGEAVYNLTYALMAGVATRLSEAMHLDLGYRFANLGPFEQSGSFANGTTAQKTSYDDLLVHEFRAGLRFDF